MSLNTRVPQRIMNEETALLKSSVLDIESPTIRCANRQVILQNLCKSAYFRANVVYLLYALGIIYIDYGGISLPAQNFGFLILGLVHCCNAAMYVYVWYEERSIKSCFLFPDYLNILGAMLYMYTAILYPYEIGTAADGTRFYTKWFLVVRYLEMVASVVELFAAFGWNYQWIVEYSKAYKADRFQTAGRGLTLDDPDIWANITIVLAASFYVYYNFDMYQHSFKDYDTARSYKIGDVLYLVNSVLYTLASCRDCGAFWFMPTAGIWPD